MHASVLLGRDSSQLGADVDLVDKVSPGPEVLMVFEVSSDAVVLQQH